LSTSRLLATACALALSLAASARADHNNDSGPRCRNVNGRATWTIIPSPNDQFGRILGPSTGDLKASISAYITSLVTQPDGSLKATSVEVWVLDAQDILVFDGKATFTPIPGKPVGPVYDELSLTVSGGTGVYAGATGSVQVTGTGHNLFGPGAGPGNGYFQVSYRGNICRAR
jgi:hypothetical protein